MIYFVCVYRLWCLRTSVLRPEWVYIKKLFLKSIHAPIHRSVRTLINKSISKSDRQQVTLGQTANRLQGQATQKWQIVHHSVSQCHLSSVWNVPCMMSHIQGSEDKNKGAGTLKVSERNAKQRGNVHRASLRALSLCIPGDLHSFHFHNRLQTPSCKVIPLFSISLAPSAGQCPLANSTRAEDIRAH